MSELPTTTRESEDLSRLLHSRGQRSTPQRNVILRELRRRSHHATVDEIRGSVRAALPGTSTPTVYATLELLVELGLARRIVTGLGPALYDGRTDPHQHLVCRRCGRVEDLDVVLETDRMAGAAAASGFQAEAAELVISGVCGDCARETAGAS
jgi:Fur family ferric uptake transcriptional regulator/Fur family peroxide stress response transcriptional regulator